MNDGKEPPLTQREKFEKAAREAECDDDEQRWNERMRKLAKAKPKTDEDGKR
jgi:hypothetical protein